MIRERAFGDRTKDDRPSLEDNNLKPQTPPKSGSWIDREFFKQVVETTCHIKTGINPGTGLNIDVKPFSLQKAKIVNLGRSTFHTFVIRTPKQRRPYSDTGEGEVLLLSGKNEKKDKDQKANLY